ncbi:MAG: dihydropteroate synthase [Verrucomicrobia bacterium CG_4_10_14_3_um_filter_43_23]|nr:MAG: dihydropteroate synthase [Verrucomicrobia bacterium CG1_02_43_26]PIP59650.1 MAG: dihydropteroate synthase [Verrucomicrobia bacterium CG22_combo_CG10-13_8_21_14_all_43_17]PIX58949.1 MAG: dihydropteroate synthase [Verrucomicrobia bacterium CG_4_10_14_3_um_filter_43_23]PIY63094.1 MAG: dihydropteroate synthase [Verrucomicrobia bacterium CG_4_10_14_0_8_um_filter_43_34]PJA43601.1 MAG: dihydropteroate synthase [Verrucomicrobia bacterium CG_4_9_14_3_um_filter_43_20]
MDNHTDLFSTAPYQIMGILNVTPDSFSDGGKFTDPYRALEHAKSMVLAGATIVDIGGESSRPDHTPITETEELKRVIPIIECLVKQIRIPISIDTCKSNVADAALKGGAKIVNDIWGFQKDAKMAHVAAKHNARVILMHNQEGTFYPGDLIDSIKCFLNNSIKIATDAGVPESHIWLDPGFGFGKDPDQNMELLGRLDEIVAMGYPVVLGTSRKSTLSSLLNLPPKELASATAATTVMGMAAGASIFRVHDVKDNYRAMKVAEAILKRKQEPVPA